MGHWMSSPRTWVNRRGRNLANDKLGPLNPNLGRHATTQATFLYIANSIYNDLPAIITNIDENQRFKTLSKKHYLGTLNADRIPLIPRIRPITQPYLPEIDDECDSIPA